MTVTMFSFSILHQGRIQDFHWGGGGRKRLCARTHISAEPNSISAGVQGPLKGPAMEAALGGLFKYSLVLSEPYF